MILRPLVLAALAATLALGCSSKVDDCNKIIDVHNSHVDEIKKISMDKPEDFEALASIIDKTSKEYGALKLTDEGTKAKAAGMAEPDKAMAASLRDVGASMKALNEAMAKTEAMTKEGATASPEEMTKSAAEVTKLGDEITKKNAAMSTATDTRTKAWDDFHAYCTK